MNAPVLVAQLAGSAPQTSSGPPKDLKIEKPQDGQALTLHLDGNTRLDFSDIASEKLTFVRVGDRLIVLFDNHSTVTVDPVFDAHGHPLADVVFEMTPDRMLTGDEFASLFPITTDQSVLPAAGTPGAPGIPAGAHFGDPTVDPLSTGTPLDLLTGENTGSTFNAFVEPAANPTPIPGPITTLTVNEDALPGGNPGLPGVLTVTGSLNVDFGTDLDGRSFAFAPTQGGLSTLTSDGQAIHLFVTTIGGLPTMIGYVGTDPSIVANEVFSVSLNADATINGTYTFTLLRPLDHPGPGTDTLDLAIGVIATDRTGDTASTVINVDVIDSVPIIIAADETHSTITDPVTGTVATATGSLGISWGADNFNDHVDGGVSATTGKDGDRAVVFSDAVVTATGDDAGVVSSIATLTSNGLALQYVLLNNGTELVAYTGNTAPTTFPTDSATAASEHVVFTVSLSDASNTGNYTISQYQSLDHNSGATLFDSIDVSFHYTATDSDGDPVSSTLTATIDDTVPTVTESLVTHSTITDPVIPADSTATGTLGIDWGADSANAVIDGGITAADGDRAVIFTNATVTATGSEGGVVTGITHLTSENQAVNYVVLDNGTALVAYTGGTIPTTFPTDATSAAAEHVVFTVGLTDDSATGGYTVTQYAPLDDIADGTKFDSIDLTFNFTAVDSDGDPANGTLTVTVDDTTPVITGTIFDQFVSEDALSDGNHIAGDITAVIATASLGIDWGADNEIVTSVGGFGRTLAFLAGDDSTVIAGGAAPVSSLALAVAGEQGGVLSSGGVALVYSVTANANGGETLTAFQGTTQGATIFTLSLDPTANNGSYTFTLDGPLDNAANSSSIALTFTVQATDADGDAVQQHFTVDVQDDVPVLSGTLVGAESVFEGGLSGGNGTSPNDPTSIGATTPEALNIDWGADDAIRSAGNPVGRTLSFLAGDDTTPIAGGSSLVSSLAMTISGEQGTALSSGGVALVYTVTANTNGGETLTAFKGTTGGPEIFTLTLDPTQTNGGYVFNLMGPLDDAANSNTIGLTFTVQAADADGNTVNTQFLVNVQDDVPVTSGTAVAAESVFEGGLTGGNGAGDATALTEALNIDWGADSATRPGDSLGRSLSFLAGDDSTVLSGGSSLVSSLAMTISGEQGTALSSGGVALVYTVTANTNGGETLTAFKGTTSGPEIFTLTLDPTQTNGGYVFNLMGPLDDAANSNTIGLTFTVQAADADGDTVNTQFTVNVQDDVPIAGVGAPETVKEANLWDGSSPDRSDLSVTGSLNVAWGADANNSGVTDSRSIGFQHNTASADVQVTDSSGDPITGLTSNGHTVQYGIFNGVLVGYVNNDPTFEKVFTVSLNDNGSGSYTFTLLNNLDHPAGDGNNNLNLTFDFTATDSDGDTSSNTFTVTVVDDVPTAHVGDAGFVNEANLPDGNAPLFFGLVFPSTSGDLNIVWGADNGNARSVTFQSNNAAQDVTVTDSSGHAITGLTSDGATVNYAFLNGVLVGYTGSNPHFNQVFTVSLNDNGDGSYTFTLLGNLDHPPGQGTNLLNFTFDYTATDSDGDPSSSTFTVSVKDSVPLAFNVGLQTVGEEGLADGNHHVFGEVQNASTGNVSLNIAWGADDGSARTVVFSSNTVSSLLGLNLTSNGQALSYSISPDGTLLTASAGGHSVFTVQLSNANNGTYDFTLLDNIDHPAVQGGNFDNLTFNVVATDSDGDPVSQSFTVGIQDDVPVLVGNVTNGIVSEDGLPTGNDISGANHVITLTNEALNISWGADNGTLPSDANGRTLTFNVSNNHGTITPVDSQGHALNLTSDGTALQYVLTNLANGGQEIDAYRGGIHNASTLIFTVTLDPIATNGAYSFTLSGNLDDVTSHGSPTTNINLNFGVTATDSDGDTVQTNFSVDVLDDVPTVSTTAVTPETVFESGLSTGTTAGNLATPTFAGTTGTPELLNINWGADSGTQPGDANGRSLSFLAGNDTTVLTGGSSKISSLAMTITGEHGTALTSGGVALVYTIADNSNGGETLTAHLGTTSGTAIFTLTLDPTQPHGGYVFNLLGPLDDASNSNSIGLTFTVQAADSDGDTVNTSFTVNVSDDAPTVTGTVTPETVFESGLSTGTTAGNLATPTFAGTTLAPETLNINWGADSAIHPGDTNGRTLSFLASNDTTAIGGGSSLVSSLAMAISGEQGTALSSGGVALVYTVAASTNGGETLTAFAGVGGAQIFTLTLDPTQPHGGYVFNLLGPLDDASSPNSSSIGLTFTVQAADADGDTVNTSFTVNVTDDAPTVTGTVTPEMVFESGLSTGTTAGNLATPTSLGTTTPEALNINWGADSATQPSDTHGRTLSFLASNGTTPIAGGSALVSSLAMSITGEHGTALTSGGVALVYTVTATTNGGETLAAFAGNTSGPEIFTLTLDPTQPHGGYVFNLLGTLDDASTSNSIGLTFTVQAADADGDTVNTSFVINISDDKPTVTGSVTPETVFEGGLTGGNGTPPDPTFAGTTLAPETLNINWGADNATHPGDTSGRTLSFLAGNGSTPIAGGSSLVSSLAMTISGEQGTALTSGGVALVYTVTATTNGGETLTAFKGTTGGAEVFTLTLDPTQTHGGYVFNLLGPLDDASSPNSNSIGLTFTVQAADADGDTVNTSFTINVTDDVPLDTTPAVETVLEHTLVSQSTASVSESLGVHFGADGPAAVVTGGITTTAHSFNFTNGNNVGTGFTASSWEQVGGDLVGALGAPVVFKETDGHAFLLTSVDLGLFGTPTGGLAGQEVQIVGLDANGNPIAGVTALVQVTTIQDGGTTVTFNPAGTPFATTEVFGLSINPITSFAGQVFVDNLNIGTVTSGGGQEVSGPVEFTNLSSAIANISAVDNMWNSVNLNTLTSGGQAVHFELIDAVTLVGYTGSTAPTSITASNVVFSVVLAENASNPNGVYTFTLDKPLDDLNPTPTSSINFTFNFTATDFDGDTTANTFTVNVTDDTPTVTGTVTAETVSEGGLSGGNSPGAAISVGTTNTPEALNINWGADNATHPGDASGRTLSFLAGNDTSPIAGGSSLVSSLAMTISGEQGTALTSGGVALVYTVTANTNGGETLIAFKGATSGPEIFTLTLDPTQTHGGYVFNLLGTLDDAANSNSIGLTFTVQAADSDGDTVNTSFTVNVTDDTPTVTGTVTAETVSEGGLSGGNSPGAAISVGTTNTPEALNINWGADNATHPGDASGRTLSFLAGNDTSPIAGGSSLVSSLAMTISGEQGTALTSGGVALVYTVTANTNGGETLTAFKGTTGGPEIFTLTLDPTQTHGGYVFNLMGPLDDAANPNSNSIGLTFTVQAADSDGDTVNTSFTVNVTDDVPTDTTPATTEVLEHTLVSQPTVPDSVSGSLGVSFGADGPGTIAAYPGTPQTFNFNGLNGPLTTAQETFGNFVFNASQGAATGTLEGTTITLKNSANPFTLTSIDLGLAGHSSGSSFDNVTLIGLDAQGNQVASLTVNIGSLLAHPGDPLTYTFNAAGTVFAGLQISTLEVQPAEHTLNLNASAFIDNVVVATGMVPAAPAPVAFTDLATAINNISITDQNGNSVSAATLTSHGLTVQYELLDTATLVAYTGSAPTSTTASNVVFSVVLSQNAGNPNGAYDFTLDKPLDDVPAAVTDLNFTFNFTATDFDGDTTPGKFTVDVHDDVPTLVAQTPVGIVDGNFLGVTGVDFTTPASWSQPLGAIDSKGSIEGWTYTASPVGGATQVQLERVDSGYAGSFSPDGSPMVDLEASPGNIQVSQTIAGLTNGEHILVSFDIGEANFGNAKLEVLWDGQDIGTYNPQNGPMQFESIGVTGNGSGSDTLTFREIGISGDNTGTFLTDVSAQQVAGTVYEAGLNDTVNIDVTVNIPGVGPYVETLPHQIIGTEAGAANAPTTASGTLTGLVQFGADGPAMNGNTANGFELVPQNSAAATSFVQGLGLSSLGSAVNQATLVGDTLTATAADGHNVFTLTVNGDGTWTFNLLAPLVDSHQGADSITLDFSSLVKAVDFDGDAVGLAAGTFSVAVVDDVPVDTGTPITGVVSESGLPAATQVFNPLDISYGADGESGHLAFASNTISQLSALGLTSGGVALSYELQTTSGGEQQIVAFRPDQGDSTPVFEVTLNSPVNPEYIFTLSQPLDHNGTLPLNFTVVATDGDGDTVQQSFTVDVQDSVPTIGTSAVGDVSEDGPLTLINAPLAVNFGADNGTFAGSLLGLTFTDGVVTATDPHGTVVPLTSDGNAVSIAFIGTELIGYTGATAPTSTTDSHIVFSATLSPSGTYDFTLNHPLDNTAPVGANDSFNLTFDITATDSDGSQATGHFTVNVDAAGSTSTPGLIDYSNETSGVFVNLSDSAATDPSDGQVVQGHTATDLQSGGGDVVGIDQLGTITDATGGSGNDLFVPGASNATLTGGAGIDTAQYTAATLTAASFSYDSTTQSWVVTTTNEGTDHLQGIEVVTDGTHRFLLVGGGSEYTTIQAAINAAQPGDTILIAPGSYTETAVDAGVSSTPSGLYINTPNLTLQGYSSVDGSMITTAAQAETSGPTVISGAENDFGANFLIGTNGSGTTIEGLHLAAGADTTNKLIEITADGVTIKNDFVDTNYNGTDTGAAAIYIDNQGTAINSYLIDHNILNEGIYVASGVGTAGTISTTQIISNNEFTGSFDPTTGDGRYDMVAVQGQLPGVGWQPDPAQVPTIEGNTLDNNETPFIFRMSEVNPALLPTAAEIATIVADNTNAGTSYAYVLNPDGTIHTFDHAYQPGDAPYQELLVANSIDTLDAGFEPGNVIFGDLRDTMDSGDTVIVQSVGSTVSDIVVDSLIVEATATSTDLTLTLDPAFSVHSITLADYAPGQGANVDVTGNDLGDTIIGNSGDNVLTGGAGNDVIVGGFGADTISGGDGNDRIDGGQNLIVNGGFQASELIVSSPTQPVTTAELGGGWTVTSGNVDIVAGGGSLNAEFPAGINMIDTKGESDGTIAQTFATVVGDTYTVSFLEGTNPDLLTHSTDTSASVTVSATGAASESFVHSLPPGTTWANIEQTLADETYTFTATSTSTTISFAANPASNGPEDYGVLIGQVYVEDTSPTAQHDGNNIITDGNGNDVIQGGGGNDTITVGNGNDLIIGGSGNDTINAGGGSDFIAGGAGNDSIFGGAGNDTFVYTVGDGVDTVVGGTGTGTQIVNGIASAETFNINALDATHLGIDIEAGANNDVLATSGNAQISDTGVQELVINLGTAGDTVVVGGSLDGTGLATNTITINGGAGDDTVDLSQFTSNQDVVYDGAGNDANGDTVIYGFAFQATGTSYAPIFDSNGNLIGASITYQSPNGDGPVTDTITNVENFEFAGSTLTLHQLFPPSIVSAETATVTEAGDLPGVDQASLGEAFHIAPALAAQVAGNGTVTSELTTLAGNPSDVGHMLGTIESQLGVNEATAIAIVWDNLNTAYVAAGADQTGINEAFVYLGVEYAAYLKAGGMPLVDVTAKFTPDMNNDGIPDRDQSLHDNLLGNITTYALDQHFSSDPTLIATLSNAISAVDPDLLGRPYASGDEGDPGNAAAQAFDVADGFVTEAHGTLAATDPIPNMALTWSISGPSTYGTMAINATTGAWTYTLDDSLPATQALAQGEDVTQTFTATVTDAWGQTDTTNVTVTIDGSNDAPVIGATSVTSAVVAESSELPGFDQAGPNGAFQLAPSLAALVAGNSTVNSEMAGLATNPSDVANTLTTVETQLHVNEATAIGIVWNELNTAYVTAGANQPNINEAFVYLGIEYAAYLKAGGTPLVDVVAKYAADANNDGIPDRDQSLHDNLLGNITTYALDQHFSSDPTLIATLTAAIDNVDADLLVRPYASGDEGDPGNAAAQAFDATEGFAAAPATNTLIATGTLVATDPDQGATQTWSIVNDSSTVYGTMAINAATGQWTYTLDNSLAATQALAQGETATQTFTATVTDDHGATDSINVTVTIDGVNNAPVIDVASSTVAATVTEAGDLPGVDQASLDNAFHIAPALAAQVAGNSTVTSEMAGLAGDPSDVHNTLGTIESALGVNEATAIAIVWDNLNTAYVAAGANQTGINEAFVYLGVEYAAYLKAGGMPLVDVTAKFTPDMNNDGIPDRDQSLHDNLLGNITEAALQQHFAGDTTILTALTAAIDNVDPNLLNRPYASGDEGDPGNAAAQAFDVANGYVTTATGTLVATDPDHGATQTWSIVNDSSTVYGTMAINASTGVWTYSLDDSLPATQALAQGQIVTQTFTATVTDDHGATDNTTVTVTIDGSNDAATFSGVDTGSVTEAGGVNNGTPGIATTGGTLVVSDVDSPSTIVAENNVATTYGHFTIGTTGVWSYTLDDNNAAVQALNTNSTPLQDVITVASADGTTHQIDVTINGADDAPVNTIPGSETVSNTAQLTFSAVNGNAISVADVDNTTLTETLMVSHGTLSLSGETGLTFVTGDGTADATMTFSGTVSAIDAALNGLVYTPTPNFVGTDTLQIVTSDGTLTDSDSIGITVQSTDHAPVITSAPETANIVDDYTSTIPTGNVVTDGGFESGLTGWTGVGFYYTPANAGSAYAHSGSAEVYFVSDYAVGTWTTSVSTVAGVNYVLNFWAAETFSGQNSIAVSWNGQTVLADSDVSALSNCPTSSGYTEYSVDVVGTGGASNLVFSLNSGSGSWFLDDVSMTATGVTPGTETAGGVITFTDADVGDTHTVTVAANNNIGTFTATLGTESSDNSIGTVNWTFSATDAQISALVGAQQSTTETYTVTIDDGHGGTASQNVTVDISNPDHLPQITSGAQTGTVTEDLSYSVNTSQLVQNGGFESDLNDWRATIQSKLGDILEYQEYPAQAGRQSLDLWTGSDAANDVIKLTQSVASTVAGVPYTLTFFVSNDDGYDPNNFIHVIWNNQTVLSLSALPETGFGDFTEYSVTLIGTGTTSTLEFDFQNTYDYAVDSVSLLSLATPGTEVTTGVITFTDPDVDPHTVSVAPIAGATGYIGTLTATIGTDSINGSAGTVDWTYSVSDAATASLGAGQSLTQTYVVTINDGHGGVTSQDVTITINGTAPTVVSEAITSASGVQNNYLSIGDVVTITVTMNETVTVTGHPELALLIGGNTVEATYASGSGSSTLVFHYTIPSTLTANDDNGISIPQNALSLNGTITDAGGKAAVLTAASVADNASYKVDITPPTVSKTAFSGTTVSGTFSDADSGVTKIVVSDTTSGHTFSNATATLNTTAGTWSLNNSKLHSGDHLSITATDAAGNTTTITTTAPAGASGSPINLALTDYSNQSGMVSLTVAGLAAGWALSEGTQNADGSWTVQTHDIGALSVTSPDGYVGALVLDVSESWTNADGTVGTATVADNVEAYAHGSPIFAWSGDDTLTASAGNDTLVFANQIGTDVVHSFDTVHDKIDLIGFNGFASFADVQAHLASDASGNAVITLADGETITLNGVNAASLNAGDFEFNQTPVTTNTGDMVIGDGALLPLSGIVDNTGSIHLGAVSSETDLEIVQHGVTLEGGGTMVLSDNSENVIFGSDPSVTFTNVDNTISGAGQIGEGQMTLVNEGSIIADGTNALMIDTGVNAVINSGTLESTGTGGLTVHSDLANDGLLWANGGNLTLDGDVSGTGSMLISGNANVEVGGAFNEQILFDNSAAGTLTLDHSADFTGILSGFGDHDSIDLGDILASTASISYAENAAGTGGTLTVNDGSHTANIAFSGQYAAADFHLGSDSANHVLVQIEQHAHQVSAAA